MCGCGCLLLVLIAGGLIYTILHHLWFLALLLLFLAVATGGFGYKMSTDNRYRRW